MRYLICYDISDDKQRTRIAKRLRQLGMKRLQKSVFIGTLKKKYHNEFFTNFLSIIDVKKDSFCMIPLNLDVSERILQFGQKTNLEYLLSVSVEPVFH